MDNYLLHRLTHDVVYHSVIDQDDYGNYEFATPNNIKAFRHGKVSMVTNLDGEEVLSRFQLIIDTVYPVVKGDELEFQGVRYTVLAYSHFDGLKAGTGTTVLYL